MPRNREFYNFVYIYLLNLLLYIRGRNNKALGPGFVYVM